MKKRIGYICLDPETERNEPLELLRKLYNIYIEDVNSEGKPNTSLIKIIDTWEKVRELIKIK